MMKLSILITAQERVTAPVRGIRAAIRGMVVSGERDVAKLDRMMERLRNTAVRTAGFMGRSIRNGAIAAAAGTAALAKGVMATGIQFENFETTLTTTLKSASKAKSAMAWIQDFATRTPFELDEVTKAYVNLTAFGIEPTMRAMTSIGDTAAVYKGMGKTMDDVVQAIADAQNGGGFERLKEFGVQGSVKGKSVFLAYSTASGRMRKQVTNDADAIREAVLNAFDAVNGGGAQRMSNTFSGRLGNLADQWTNFKLQIANAGVFDWAKGQLGKFLTYLDSATGKAAKAEWAKKISDGMIRVGNALINVDWASVGKSLASIAKAIVAIGGAIAAIGGGGLDGVFNMSTIGAIVRTAVGLNGVAKAFNIVKIAGMSVGGIIGVIALIAAGAFLIWRNWDSITAFFKRTWESVKKTFSDATASIWAALPGWFRGILTGASFVIKTVGNLFSGGAERPFTAGTKRSQTPAASAFRFGPMAPPARSIGPRQASGGKPASGRVDVQLHLTTDRGARVSTKKLASNNRDVRIDVTRGPVVASG